MKNILSWLVKLLVNVSLVVFIALCVVYLLVCVILSLPIIIVILIIMAVQENNKPFKIVP